MTELINEGKLAVLIIGSLEVKEGVSGFPSA